MSDLYLEDFRYYSLLNLLKNIHQAAYIFFFKFCKNSLIFLPLLSFSTLCRKNPRIAILSAYLRKSYISTQVRYYLERSPQNVRLTLINQIRYIFWSLNTFFWLKHIKTSKLRLTNKTLLQVIQINNLILAIW